MLQRLYKKANLDTLSPGYKKICFFSKLKFSLWDNFRATVLETTRTQRNHSFFVVFMIFDPNTCILHNAWEKGVCTETNDFEGENLCYIILSRWCPLAPSFLDTFADLTKIDILSLRNYVEKMTSNHQVSFFHSHPFLCFKVIEASIKRITLHTGAKMHFLSKNSLDCDIWNNVTLVKNEIFLGKICF